MKETKELVKKHRWTAFKVKFGYLLESLGATKDYSVGDIVLYRNKKCYIIEKNKPFWDLSEFCSLKIYKNVNEADFSSANFLKNFINRFLSYYKWRKSYWFNIHLKQEIVKSIGKHSF